MKKVLAVLLVLVLGVVTILYLAGGGAFGRHEAPGEVTPHARPADAVTREEMAQATAHPAGDDKQILFGDLHVHSTFSSDAFLFSLPMVGGEGAHPPADACDFARFCSALDFWSINDHAEASTPRHWAETVETIRRCNAVAQDPENPDTVAFLGWEWTQVGETPQTHFGHKNVVLAGIDDDEIPARPIAAARRVAGGGGSRLGAGLLAMLSGEQRVHDLMKYSAERAARVECDPAQNVRDLPVDCHEVAETPEVLFRKLDEWDLDALVIPHGTTWGMYTPQGEDLAHQLRGNMHDPDRQTLFEIYSGHGDSERYRAWRAIEYDASGAPVCPEPTDGYLPTCWQAGEIIRKRCLAEGESAEECETRAAETRTFAANAGSRPHLTVPAAQWSDWLDAGQCRDCDQPAFNYRPGGSGQYALAVTDVDTDGGAPRRFRFGFLGSSDNHFARPGTGYKEVKRRGMTESMGTGAVPSGIAARFLQPPDEDPVARGRPAGATSLASAGFAAVETERVTSYLYTGGLVAVHATGRDRPAIWEALERREVYGTSGPRILLWFDLQNGPDGEVAPMGSEVSMTEPPVFRARAVGSFEQKPGCPDYTVSTLSAGEIERLCKGECYHPSDQRRKIARIEVVRIRPQTSPDEDVTGLIEDPWKTFECPDDPSGCLVTFSDPQFADDGRDTVYYVRAIEEPAPAINAAGITIENGEPKRCPGPAGADDDCLAQDNPRAWSSPIFVDHAA